MEGYTSTIALITYAGLVLTIGSLFVRHRVRYLIIFPIFLGTLFAALVRILPNYDQGPNLNTFFSQQKTQLIVRSETKRTDAYIQIKSVLQDKKLAIQAGVTNVGLLSSPELELAFVGPSTDLSTHVYLEAKNGAVIELMPSSLLTLSGSIPAPLSIMVRKGKIASYIPKDGSPTTISPKSDILTPDSTVSKYMESFNAAKLQSLKQQIRGDIYLQEPIRTINRAILAVLYTLRPRAYTDNIANYNAFIQYFPEEKNTLDTNNKNTLIKDEFLNQ